MRSTAERRGMRGMPSASESVSGLANICTSFSYLLNPLADSLADRIPRMPGRPPVDRTASPTGVLCHMGRDAAFAQVGDTGLGVVAFVRSQRLGMEPIVPQLVDQLRAPHPIRPCRWPASPESRPGARCDFPSARGRRSQAGFFARHPSWPTVLRDPSDSDASHSSAFLRGSPPTDCWACRRRTWLARRRLVSGSEALEAGRSFDQRAIHGEVFIAQQAQLIGLQHHRIEELAGDVVRRAVACGSW